LTVERTLTSTICRRCGRTISALRTLSEALLDFTDQTDLIAWLDQQAGPPGV